LTSKTQRARRICSENSLGPRASRAHAGETPALPGRGSLTLFSCTWVRQRPMDYCSENSCLRSFEAFEPLRLLSPLDLQDSKSSKNLYEIHLFHAALGAPRAHERLLRTWADCGAAPFHSFLDRPSRPDTPPIGAEPVTKGPTRQSGMSPFLRVVLFQNRLSLRL
jgi:hypothetical protein